MRKGVGGKESQPEVAAADKMTTKGLLLQVRMRTSQVTCLMEDDVKWGNDWTTNNRR